MLDVLIVDDEPVARESLRYLIDWEAYGFRVASEAGNGQQALELLASRHYSLVLTDIRMPTMNGLELIARLKAAADTEFVILSGYDDFEYARQGMKLGVSEYLLKPVDEEELASVLARVAERLAEKRRSERRLRLGLEASRDRLLRRLAQGAAGASEREEQLALLGLDSGASRFAGLIVEMDFVYGDEREGALTERDVELKRYAVRNVCEELVGSRGYVFELSEERYGVLLLLDGPGGAVDARTEAERLVSSVKRYAKSSATVGLGAPVMGYDAIRASFEAAEDALDRKFLLGGGAVLESERLVARGASADAGGAAGEAGPFAPRFHAATAVLLDAAKQHRREDALAALDRLWGEFASATAGAAQAKPVVIELFVELYRLVREAGANHVRLFDPSIGDYERVMRAKTLEELYRLARDKCADALDLLHGMRELRPNKIVEAMKRLVQEHYRDNISLRSVAQQIYMNPNYLGKLFKTNAGTAFNDYVLQVRMEKAKELLATSDMKVYEIANEVGFGELDWFYKRFKAYTGVSTSEYRNGVR